MMSIVKVSLMTSSDNVIDVPRLELLLREHFARTETQLAGMRKDNAEFMEQMTSEISAFKEETRREFDKVHAEISVMQSDMRVRNTRIDNLIHWNYWLIAFVVAFFTLPSIADGLKSLLKALASVILAKFSGKPDKELE